MSEKDFGFTRMPTEWIRRSDLVLFKGGGDLGRSVTALKLYITILGATRSDNTFPGPGKAKLTFSDLEDRAHVARAMIADALTFLRPWVRTTHARQGNTYEIADFTTAPGKWVKVPTEYIFRHNALRAFPARSSESLAALKLYLYLLERRERRSTIARVSYDKIRERTGILQNDIPRAITALGGADLVRCYSARRFEAVVGPNTYHIVGIQAESGSGGSDIEPAAA